jgi:hypothetical protein
MSDLGNELDKPAKEADSDSEEQTKGFSLTLVYSLIALALFAAMGIALLIVLPFYHRR